MVTPPALSFRSKGRLIIMAMAGNFLELYDFALYGVLLPILAPLYFPHSDPWVGQIIALSVFTIGFLSRPLGALIFGILGDRTGRKSSLMLSIALMALATGGIGVLPTYAQIGIAAPILLVIFRLLQGLSTGGESNASIIYVMEHFPNHQRGLASSLMSAATISGVILATFLAGLLTRPELPENSWRLCFLIGSSIGILGYFIRKNLSESPFFIDIMEKNRVSKQPFKEIFQKAPGALLQTFLLSAVAGALQLSLAGFINMYLVDHLNLPFSTVSMLNVLCLGVYVLMLPIAGFLADRVNPAKLLMLSCGLTLCSMIPIYELLDTLQIPLIILAQLWLSLICALYMGAKSLTLFQLFETRVRLTGISFGYAAGISLFGGFTPILSKLLIKGGFTPALLPMACALVSGTTLWWMQAKRR